MFCFSHFRLNTMQHGRVTRSRFISLLISQRLFSHVLMQWTIVGLVSLLNNCSFLIIYFKSMHSVWFPKLVLFIILFKKIKTNFAYRNCTDKQLRTTSGKATTSNLMRSPSKLLKHPETLLVMWVYTFVPFLLYLKLTDAFSIWLHEYK